MVDNRYTNGWISFMKKTNTYPTKPLISKGIMFGLGQAHNLPALVSKCGM